MKLAWIIQGEPQSAWSYFIQIKLFSKYLNRYGHHSHIINYTDFKKDLLDIKKAVSDLNPDVLLNIGDVHILNLAETLKKPVIFIVTNGTGILSIKGPVKNSIFACTSRFAQKLYQSADISPTPYLPHGFDPKIFYPSNRLNARKKIGWTHKEPTILMLGTNYSQPDYSNIKNSNIDRKNFTGGLKAFALLHQKRPDVKLYLHTNAYGAINLPQEITRLNLNSSVILADTSSSQKNINTKINTSSQSHIADLFRASNLLLFPSIGESFGVPIIEAQACGTPVIVTDTGPMSELVLTGQKVKTKPHPSFPAWATPNTKELTKAMLKWVDYDQPQKTSKSIQSFSIDSIINKHFLNLLNDI